MASRSPLMSTLTISTTHKVLPVLPQALQKTHAVKRRRRWQCQASNLGELERFAAPENQSASEQQWTISPETGYTPEPRFDGPTAAVSLLLLFVLTAVGADRILGLTDFVKRALLDWKEQRAYARRNQAIEAREKLEAAFQSEDEGGTGDGNDGESGK